MNNNEAYNGCPHPTENMVRHILHYIDDNALREGLLETPTRYIRFLKEFTTPAELKFTTFKNEGIDEMIIVQDIPFYSLCEHHLAPFFGTGAIAYIPNEKIVGLSKLPRVLDMFARRLQNQERITQQVANFIKEHLKPKGVAVFLKARHLCIEMRGIQKPGSLTKTSVMLGAFKEELNARNEFLNLVK